MHNRALIELRKLGVGMPTELWLASFKARVLPGCEVDFDGSDFMVGEAAGYANSIEEFSAHIMSELTENKFEFIEFFHVSPTDQAKWVMDHPDKADILEAVEDAKVNGKFAFGAFRSSNFLKEFR
jgi:hypothetical protein